MTQMSRTFMMWLSFVSPVLSPHPDSLQLHGQHLRPSFTEPLSLHTVRHGIASLQPCHLLLCLLGMLFTSPSLLPHSVLDFAFLMAVTLLFFILALPATSTVPGMWWALYAGKLHELFMVSTWLSGRGLGFSLVF